MGDLLRILPKGGGGGDESPFESHLFLSGVLHHCVKCNETAAVVRVFLLETTSTTHRRLCLSNSFWCGGTQVRQFVFALHV